MTITAIATSLVGHGSASARADAVTQLAGTTIVSASRPVAIRVDLPHAATLSLASIDSPDVRASGDGRFIGFVLRPANASAADGSALIGGQLNDCFAPACVPGTHIVDYLFPLGSLEPPQPTNPYTIPAGNYDLYVVPDGAPATLTLQFGGLTGATEIEPDVTATAADYSPAATLPSPGTGPVLFNAGTAAPIGAPGGAFLVVNSVEATADVIAAGQCLYQDGPPVAGTYLPQCPGSDGAGAFETSNVSNTSTSVTQAGAYGVTNSPTWQVGGYAVGASAASDLHLVVMAVTYEPQRLN